MNVLLEGSLHVADFLGSHNVLIVAATSALLGSLTPLTAQHGLFDIIGPLR